MFLHLHRPGPPLDRFVELVTYYAGHQPDHGKERLLPDGAVEIIVDLTDTPKKLYDRKDHSRFTDFRRAWISGMRREWIVIEAAPGASMVVIRFRPGGAYPFLRFDVDGITDTVDELHPPGSASRPVAPVAWFSRAGRPGPRRLPRFFAAGQRRLPHGLVRRDGAHPRRLAPGRLRRRAGESAAGHGADDQKRLGSLRDGTGQCGVGRLVGQILPAGEEPQERPALSRGVVADRAAQHRIGGLESIEHRALRHPALEGQPHLPLDARQRPQVRREHDADHGSVWASTDSTAGKSRTMGAQVSPASADP
jgi:hypothetical protein